MWETILEIAAEGGKITLNGKQHEDGRWFFTRITDESVLAELFAADDDLTSAPHTNSGVVEGWTKGIQLMNDAWPQLYPQKIHPEFREIIWDSVVKKSKDTLRLHEWASVCFQDPIEAYEQYVTARRLRQ